MTSGVLDPAELPRRSPVYRELKDAGARFIESYGGAVAEDFEMGGHDEVARDQFTSET